MSELNDSDFNTWIYKFRGYEGTFTKPARKSSNALAAKMLQRVDTGPGTDRFWFFIFVGSFFLIWYIVLAYSSMSIYCLF